MNFNARQRMLNLRSQTPASIPSVSNFYIAPKPISVYGNPPSAQPLTVGSVVPTSPLLSSTSHLESLPPL